MSVRKDRHQRTTTKRSRPPEFVRILATGISAATLSLIVAPPARAIDATWTGGAATNVYNTAGNWDLNAAPTANGDNAIWNGLQAGPLDLIWNGQIGGFGGNGVNLVIDSGQTAPLTLSNAASNASLGLNNITINTGAGAFTLGPATGSSTVIFRAGGSAGTPLVDTLTNNSSNTATITSGVILQSGGASDRTAVFGGSGNWQVDAPLVTANGGQLSITKEGAGTLTITNINTSQNRAYTVNEGALVVGGNGRLGGAEGVFSGTLVINGTLNYQSTNTQTISSSISGGGTLIQSAGRLTLTGADNRIEETIVNGGTLVLAGAGQLDSTSGITINGAGAKFLQNSTTPLIVSPITLTNGTLDGTGTVGIVSVGNGTGGVITHGDGGPGTLSIEELTFAGAATINIREDGIAGTSGINVLGSLVTTPASGVVTINASQTTWASGTTFNLLSFGSFAGSLSSFAKGTISGLSVRQNASLVLGPSALALQIAGDNPEWTGLDSGNWVVGSTGANGNWRLIGAATSTDFIPDDTVLFNDNAAGTTNVTISAANVSPSLVTFDNSLKNYTLSSGAGFGIASGAVIKTGSGTVTVTTANSYAGGTTVNSGTLALSGAGTLGNATSPLAVNGEGIVDLGTTTQNVGSVTLTGSGKIVNGTISPASVTANVSGSAAISSVIAGSGGVAKSGAGTLSLTGPNTYVGGTAVTAGTLLVSGSGTLGSATGALEVATATLDLGGTSQAVGTATISGQATISNGKLNATTVNATHTVGTATVSADLIGTGGLNQTGAGGTLVLTGSNTFTGPIFVDSGAVLTLGNGGTTGSLEPLTNIAMANGGRFATNRSDSVVQGVDFGLLGTEGVQGGFFKNGTGTTTLSLANIFTGPSVINGGTLVVTNATGLGTGANGGLNIVGGTLQVSGDITMPHTVITRGDAATSNTEGSIVSSGTNTIGGAINFGNPGGAFSNIISADGTLTLTGTMSTSQAAPAAGVRTFNFGGAGDIVASGIISDNISPVVVSKTGSGALSLTGFSDYTGGTIIQEGTVFLEGAVTGVTTINGSGAALAGGGTAQAVDLILGGIAPGNEDFPIGTLGADSLTLSPSASLFEFDLSSIDNQSDLLNLSGALTKGGGTMTFNFLGGKAGETYTLMNFGSTDLTSTDAVLFQALGTPGTFAISSSALTYSVIPEPVVLTQLGLGLFMFGRFAGRRRRS